MDKQKIQFVLLYCRTGAADVFWEHVICTAATPVTVREGTQDKTRAPGYGTWAKFREDLTKSFITMDVQGEALRDLRQLKQKSQPKKSVETYIQNFKVLVSRAELMDRVTIEGYFLAGLEEDIKKILLVQLT